jgi:hypothetical protein
MHQVETVFPQFEDPLRLQITVFFEDFDYP